MTIFTKTIFVLLSPLAFVSCKQESPSTSDTSTPVTADSSAKPYPLDTCVVSGEKLDSMGEPFVITYEGTEVRFCCDSCVPEFKKDPAKYLAKLKK